MSERTVADIRRVLLTANHDHAEAQSLYPELQKALTGLDIEVTAWNRKDDDETPQPTKSDLIVVLGGDGFLMQTIRALGYPQTPIFGVNYGQVGFLMNPRMGASELASVLAEGRFTKVPYAVLEAEVELEDERSVSCLAVNDFVLERASGQTVHLHTEIDGVLLNRYSGDGLVIATAGGSSAYSLAAGGPVIHEAVDGMIVTPLYPHRPVQFHSLQFPVMLPLASKIRIVAETTNKRPVRFVADGRSIENVSEVRIDNRGLCINLLREEGYNFVDTLVQKIIGPSR